MASKRVFYVTASELIAFSVNAKSTTLLGQFELNEQGLNDFDQLLRSNPDCVSSFLVDFIEEEFQLENLPHVGVSDRAAYLKRKLKGRFQNDDFAQVQVLYREKTGKKDDCVLFSSLNRSDVLDLWLEKLRPHKVPLAGIYSIPYLTRTLLEQKKIKQANGLVVSVQQGRLLRQTLLHQGHLKLSRLRPASFTNTEELGRAIQQEAERSQIYLSKIRLIEGNKPLRVYLLGTPQDADILLQHCQDNAKVQYQLLDINSNQPNSSSGHSEWFWAQQLYRIPTGDSYIATNDRRYYKYFVLRQWTVGCAALTLLLASGWSGLNVYNGQQFAAETEQLTQQQQQLDNKKQQTQLQVDLHLQQKKHSYTPQFMKEVVETHLLLKQHQPDARRALEIIGRQLVLHPNIQLKSIMWFFGDQPTGGDGNSMDPAMAGGGDMMSGDMAATPMMGDAGAPTPGMEGMDPATMAAPPPPPAKAETALLEASLLQFPGSYQQVYQQIEALITTLQQQPQILEVTLDKKPLDYSPSATLSGKTHPPSEAVETSFVLKVVFRNTQHGS